MRTKARMRADGVTDVERPWMELVKARGVPAVRDELLERGFTPAKAAGIAMWLKDQMDGFRVVDGSTAHNYREDLRELSYDPGRAIPGYISSDRGFAGRRVLAMAS